MPSVDHRGRGESGQQRGELGRCFGVVEQAAWAGWGLIRQGAVAAVTAGCKLPRHRALCEDSRRALPALCSHVGDPHAAWGGLVGAPLAAPLGALVLVPWVWRQRSRLAPTPGKGWMLCAIPRTHWFSCHPAGLRRASSRDEGDR